MRKNWENWLQRGFSGKHLREPSPQALARARALGGGLKPQSVSAWIASLSFDSALEPLPAGLRAAPATDRRLLYEAQTVDQHGSAVQLDLCIRRESRGYSITGQLLPPWPQATVEALAGRTRRRATLGDTGEFRLRDLPATPATVRLEFRAESDAPLVIEDVPLAVED